MSLCNSCSDGGSNGRPSARGSVDDSICTMYAISSQSYTTGTFAAIDNQVSLGSPLKGAEQFAYPPPPITTSHYMASHISGILLRLESEIFC